MQRPIVQEIAEQQAGNAGQVIGAGMDRTETYDSSLIRRALEMERDGTEDADATPPAA